MPIKQKMVPDPYCDICGSKNGRIVTCAVCGGVFCCDHSVLISIDRYPGYSNAAHIYRALCENCLEKNPAISAVIQGHPQNSWDEEFCAEKGHVRQEMIEGIFKKKG